MTTPTKLSDADLAKNARIINNEHKDKVRPNAEYYLPPITPHPPVETRKVVTGCVQV
jgi:hypothetical protein